MTQPEGHRAQDQQLSTECSLNETVAKIKYGFLSSVLDVGRFRPGGFSLHSLNSLSCLEVLFTVHYNGSPIEYTILFNKIISNKFS